MQLMVKNWIQMNFEYDIIMNNMNMIVIEVDFRMGELAWSVLCVGVTVSLLYLGCL